MKYQSLIQTQEHLSNLCGASCLTFNHRAKDFIGDKRCFCRECRNRSNYGNIHLYGCYEAERWGGKYIYYCPMGFIFVSVSLSEAFTEHSVVAGPILMGEAEDFPETYGLPVFTPGKVTDLQEIMLGLFNPKQTGQDTYEHTTTEDFLREIAAFSHDGSEYTSKQYAIRLEQELKKAVMEKDAQNAKKIMNQLLGHIFFDTGSNLKRIKARVLELIVILSRAAIEGGADIDRMFALDLDNVELVSRMKSIEQLSVWLVNIINKYISYVFEFADIKHVDTVFKTTRYIRENYAQKLSLDTIAGHIYLSKSYLSKTFKEETGMSITAYINQVRVEKSKQYLADRAYSLADIANAVGFDDQSYYTKVFKAVTGISPGKYREAHGKI